MRIERAARQFGWFVLLWAAGVAAVGAFAFSQRALFGL